ncbi:MAG: GMC family oxidoreductase N-terminal domain-containing protein [Reyranella sp.]|uniref:GMC family oxidoreductase n=1 Tax=Reyranella sp. TaxID=1929291 RepID=UPI0027311D08|nr:GMC family oxidoreductase N-terminal domain-containing protein [Reyranella sp.]MDP1966974.1 GMC family oxidoreductase N-terminal domain-containing protein [Reyranella sp.]MDP2375690.1 GMC family oxidoreductase N-terminal domain-containing protein [Reyranella sp.]
MDSFDYVIVGAGSAGSVLANRLSEDPNVSVCVLEAGPSDWHPFIHIPAGFMYTLVNPRVNWLYTSEPSEWTGGRRIAAPRGKTLGGSSSINGHIYNRGQRLDFDGWAQRGNHGWGYADVLPYFRRTEQRIADVPDAIDETFRGNEGKLPITDLDWRDPLCEAFIEGAVQMGIPRNRDYNGTMQAGVSYVQRVIRNGRRVSAARAFLYPAMKRPNLTVRTHAQATEIVLEGKCATGVRYRKGGRNGRQLEVRAIKEVILCGGTVNSPQLLQVSGIGPAPLLLSLGIAVKHALPGVGENLRDHYAPRFVARVKNAMSINERSHGLRLVGEVLKYVVSRKGILALNPTLIYVFWKSDERVDNYDLQLTFTPASYKEGVQSTLDDFPGMTIASWQQRPDSTGYVRARSADPFEAPLIQPNYLAAESDRRVLLAGMKLARRLLGSQPLAKYYDREEFPGAEKRSDDDLLTAAKQRGTTTFHLMGSCRMAPDSDPTAVVDDQLRVRGLEGLRVVDASIMPTMPSANLNASVLMIAEKAADMIRGRPALEAVVLKD